MNVQTHSPTNRRGVKTTPNQYSVSWSPRLSRPEQNLDPSSHFCNAQACDRQTDRRTTLREHRSQQSASRCIRCSLQQRRSTIHPHRSSVDVGCSPRVSRVGRTFHFAFFRPGCRPERPVDLNAKWLLTAVYTSGRRSRCYRLPGL